MRSMIPLVLVLMVGTAMAGDVDLAKRADEVRAAEIAFAKTMADRDHEAFKRFIAPDAMFFGRSALHGIEAIAEAWKPLYEGPEAPFSWKPSRVEVNATGDLALSTGPVRGANGVVESWYVSTWRREPDGSWKVVLDMGTPRCPFPED